MAFSIQCPECGASLKAKKSPRPDKPLKCLKCGAAFTLADLPVILPSGTSGARERLAAGRQVSDAVLMPRVLLGIAGLAVVAGIAFTVFAAMRPANPNATTKTTDPIAEIPSPRPQPKPDPKPKSEPEVTPEPKADVEAERRRQQYTNLMIDAGIASQFKKFDEAVTAYGGALKLFPDDADAKQKLADAQNGLKGQEQARRNEDKANAEIAALIQRGQDAFDRDEFPAAIDFFKRALERSPTNPEAAQKLLLAQNRLQQAEAEKRKFETFDQHILAGKAALQAGRSAEAIREFLAAGKLLPKDPLPPELLKEAEKQFAENKGDDDKKKQYQTLVDDGKGFLRVKKIDQAEDAFRQALKLFPNDAIAQQGLKDAVEANKKAKGDVGKAIAQAQAAINANQMPQAMALLRDVDRAFPNNSDVLRAIQIAELIQANRVAYFQAIGRGNRALVLRSYGDAILAYSAALQIVPGDPQASIGLLDAQRGLDALTILKANYDAAVAQGAAFLRVQNYFEAARAFERAVALCQLPLVADAQVLALARYAAAMAQGNAALAAGQYQQAAQFYQVALTVIPNDIAAQTGIQRVRFALSKGRAG